MEMGLITPPVGLNLYVLKGISPHIALKEILIGSVPFICVLGIAIALFSVSRRSFCSCRNCCIESLTPVVDLGGGLPKFGKPPLWAACTGHPARHVQFVPGIRSYPVGGDETWTQAP
jgi:hypothetical protein